MRFSRVLISALCIALLIGVLNTVCVEAAPPQQGPTVLRLQRVGTSSFASAPMATDISGLPDDSRAAKPRPSGGIYTTSAATSGGNEHSPQVLTVVDPKCPQSRESVPGE
jgi:hypothetical protein